jgi:hypothetical protein
MIISPLRIFPGLRESIREIANLDGEGNTAGYLLPRLGSSLERTHAGDSVFL